MNGSMQRRNKRIKLRYGENPNQESYLEIFSSSSIFDYQISGKKISYNNIIDIDSGLKCLSEFIEPTCIIVKHTNPCGVASSKNINQAFKRSYMSDTKSAFGGIVLMNRKININLAKVLIKNFFEVIVAPSFDLKAIDILKKKKRLILLKLGVYKNLIIENRSTVFGNLYQKRDLSKINKNFIKLKSKKKASKKNLDDLIFSIKIVKHLKSNAIVLSKNKQTVGLGNGQTNRVDALKLALKNMRKNFNSVGFVCASDGFFPFIDSISLLKKNGCKIMAQPSGSINDNKILNYSVKNRLSLYYIKNRLFKH